MRDNSAQSWDSYWNRSDSIGFFESIYSKVASFYRRKLIGPRLSFVLSTNFSSGAVLLHAGCGAGEVDLFVPKHLTVTALDVSKEAIQQYKILHESAKAIEADLLSMNTEGYKFDGIYNLGVMEHFSKTQVDSILKTFYSLLESRGRIVLFWPPVYGSSVIFLSMVHFLLKILKGRNFHPLHPDEPNKLTSRNKIRKQLKSNGFKLISMRMSPRDLFTYSVVVAQKNN
jgi:2-polyprenyl-3-methyl-5-hydroxy-6-metoxy-1,4-benzoquinol methylase